MRESTRRDEDGTIEMLSGNDGMHSKRWHRCGAEGALWPFHSLRARPLEPAVCFLRLGGAREIQMRTWLGIRLLALFLFCCAGSGR